MSNDKQTTSRLPLRAIYIRLNPDLAEAVEAEQRRYGISATDVARVALARMFESEDDDEEQASA
jgi:hypothetical protein